MSAKNDGAKKKTGKSPAGKTSKKATVKAAGAKKHIVMVASENGALNHGKVGGVGDVIRDLPPALAALGLKVTIVTPSYGFLHLENPVLKTYQISFPFNGNAETADVFKVKPGRTARNVSHVVVENIWIRGNPIYVHDPDNRPFAADASKYAMFCSAVGRLVVEGLGPFKNVDVLHLHDWHAASLLLLRELHADFEPLKKIRTVFTVHNLGIQGTRPIQNHESSLAAWFPEMMMDREIAEQIFRNHADYRYGTPCFTPMATGVALADAVNTVSPTYAEEILSPSNHAEGFWGAEGLEWIARHAKAEGRLSGILNGIEYPARRKARKPAFARLRTNIEKEVLALAKANPDHTSLKIAKQRLKKWTNRKPAFVQTSVTRATDQKLRLFFERGTDDQVCFSSLMEKVTEGGGVFILLGEGVPDLENALTRYMEEFKDFLFINAGNHTIAEHMYSGGDLFLMPSLYEPCGLSQMLAMRDVQPPLVNAVGGLKDTVIDQDNGFSFSGGTLPEKVDEFLSCLEGALWLLCNEEKGWKRIAKNAGEMRFLWADAAKRYIERVYQL